MSKNIVFATGIWLLLYSASLIAQNTPKYKPCPADNPLCYARDLGHSNRAACTGWCRSAVMRFTPDTLEACEGQTVPVNVRVDGNSLDTHGDHVNWINGQIDWGDGQTTPLIDVQPHDYTHSYAQARDYFPSADYAAEYKYDGDGSCSYHCEQQQSAKALIHLKTAPVCKGGTFKAAEPKTKPKTKPKTQH